MSRMDGSIKEDHNEASSLVSTPNSCQKRQRKWDTSLLNWVNCILGPDSFISLSREVAYALIKHFENANGTNKSVQYSDESVFRFLKKEYPYFRYGTVTDVTICPEDVILIISLLLHYSCVKSKDLTIRGNMCKTLDVTDQKAIAMFANNLVRHENITERNLLNAIKALTAENKYEESFSEISSPLQMKKDSLELSGSKTNIMSPLLQTPLRKSRKVFHLEAELGAERFDRNFLQEEVDRLHRRITELEKLEKSYLHEMQRLRGELSTIQDSNKENLAESSSCDHCTYKEKKLQDELRSHEIEVLRLLSNIHNLEEQTDILNMKLNEADSAISIWSTQAIQLEKTENLLKTQVSEMGCKISDLELELSYTKQCLNEYNKDQNLNCSIECDDDTSLIKKKLNYSLMSSAENLGETVIDVQLKEQTSKNEVLSFQLDKTVKENERLDMELQKLKSLYSDIMEASQLLKEENEKYSFKLQYLEELEAQYKECKIDFDIKIGVIDELNSKIESLLNTNNDLQKTVEKSELNICLLNTTIDLLNESVAKHSQNYNNLEKLRVKISDENDNLKKSCESKDIDMKKLNREIVALENFVDNYTIINERYKNELVDTEIKLENANRKCRQLEDKVNSLSIDLNSLKDEKFNLDRLMYFQRDEISKCNEMLSVEREKLKTIVDDKRLMTKKLSEVEYNLKTKVQEFDICLTKCTKLTEEANSFKKLIEDHEITIVKMTNEKQILVSEKNSLNDLLEKLNSKLAKLEQELIEKNADINVMQNEKLNLIGIVDNQKGEIEKGQTNLVAMNERLTEISNSKHSTDIKLEDIKSTLSIKLSELSKVSIELEEKKLELLKLNTEKSHMQNLLNDKTKIITELNGKNETLLNEKSSLQEKLESSELDICVMNASNEKLKKFAENILRKCDNLEILRTQISDENNNLKETCENNKKEIRLLTEEVATCKNLVSGQEIQIEDYKHMIVDKELKLDDLNKKCIEMEDKVNSLSNEIANLNNEKAILDNLVSLQQDQITECHEQMCVEQEKMKVLASEKISLHESLDKTNLDLIKLKEGFVEKESEVKKIVNENVELMNILNMKKIEIEKSQTELAAINNKLNDISKLKCAMETKLEDMETNLSTKIMELAKVSVELEGKNSELTDLKIENSNILLMLKEKIRIVDELNQNSEKLSNENIDLQEKIQNSESKISILNETIKTLNGSVRNLSQKCDDLEILKVQFSDDNNSLKETYENTTKQVKTLNEKISSHEKLISDYKMQIEDYKNESDSKESELNSLNNKYQELEGKVDSLFKEVSGLNSEKLKLNNVICLQQDQINEYNKKAFDDEEKLKSTTNDNRRMLKKLSDVECDLKEKIQKLDNCSVDYNKLIEEAISMKKLIEDHASTIDKYMKKEDVFNSETTSLRESLDKINLETIKLKKELMEKDSDVKKLESENLELTNVLKNQTIEIESSKTELVAMNDKLIDITNLKCEAETQVKEIESNLTTKIKELKEETDSLKNLLQVHESTIDKYIKEKEIFNSEARSLHELLGKTNLETIKLKEEFMEKDSDVKKLERENLELANVIKSQKIEIGNRKIELVAMNEELINITRLKCEAETRVKEIESNLTTKTTELTEETASLKNLLQVHDDTIDKCMKEKEILVSETISLKESHVKINLELVKHKQELSEKIAFIEKIESENLNLIDVVNGLKIAIEKSETELKAVNDKLIEVSNLKCAKETILEEIELALCSKTIEVNKMKDELKEINIEMAHLKTENSNLQNLSDSEKQKINSLMDPNRTNDYKYGDKLNKKIKPEKNHDSAPKVYKNDLSGNKENYNNNDSTIKSSKMEKKYIQKLYDFISKEISKNKKLNEALSVSTKYSEILNDDTKSPPSCAHKIDLENLVKKIIKQSSDCEKNCHGLNESFKSSKMDKSDVSYVAEDENLSFEVFETDVLQYYSNNDKTFTRFDEFEDHLFSDDVNSEYLNSSKDVKCIPLQSHSTELIAKACAQNILKKDELILNLKNECEMLNNKISDLSSDNEKLRSDMETLLTLEKNNTSVTNSDDHQGKLPCKYCSFKCTNSCCSENCEENSTNDLITSTSNSDNLKIYFDVPNVQDESDTKTVLTKIFHLISQVEVDLLIKSEKDITDCSLLESVNKNSFVKDNSLNNQNNDKDFLTTESINRIHDSFERVVDECTNLKSKLESCENENHVFKRQFYNISQVMKHTKEEISRYETDFIKIMACKDKMNNKCTSLKHNLKKIESEMLLFFNNETVLKKIEEYRVKLNNIYLNVEDDLQKLNEQIFDFTSFRKWLNNQFDVLISDSNTDESKILFSNSELLDSIKTKLYDADLLLKEYDMYSSQIKNIVKDDVIVNAGKDFSVYEKIQSISNNFKCLQNDVVNFKKQERAAADNICKIKDDYDVLVKANQQLSIENVKLQNNLEEKESQITNMAADKVNMQSVIESKVALSSVNVRLTIENTKLKEEIEMLTIKLNDVNMRMYSENVKPLIDYDAMLQENLKLVDILKQNEADKRQMETELASVKNLYSQLVIEHKNLKINGAQEDVNTLITDLRNEYEDKLSRMKIKMKQLYQEQISVYVEKQKEELTRSELLCKKYADKIKSYESHVNQLSSELWKVGEKLLMERNEKDWLKHQLRERLGSRQSLQFTSVDNGKLRPANSVLKVFDDSVKEIINESIGKIPKRVQAESGGLHMSDEESEIFDNTYLTDLKSGICEPRYSSKSNIDKTTDLPNRLSELQWRNSMCLPHLKSSYPAETQFQKFKEEDIKMGAANVDDEKASRPKKEVGQTTYKKPGPPTPSKKGGRLSLQGNDREPVKEPNDNASKKTTTPSRIRSLFMGNSSRSTQKDENTFGTPKGKRLSIFRKPR